MDFEKVLHKSEEVLRRVRQELTPDLSFLNDPTDNRLLLLGEAAITLALACGLKSEPTATKPATPAPVQGPEKPPRLPDMGLSIPEVEWERAIANKPRWQILPDASNESNLLCPTWATQICIGKTGSSLTVAINRTTFELMMDRSGLRNPKLPTRIMFLEDWPKTGPDEEGKVQAGLTTIVNNGQSELIVIWMKFVAWRSLKMAEHQNLPIDSYFNGQSSQITSEWLAHEMGHGGKEIKDFWDPAKKQYKIDTELVHPQVYAFHERYTELYNRAFTQGRGANALLVGVESIGNLEEIRSLLYAEADVRGIKFE